MLNKLLSTLFFLMLTSMAFSFVEVISDTDFFVLKNGYSFKADIVDTTGKYYVYKVYRGERLLRCVKKEEVKAIQTNYTTPAPVAKTEPRPVAETKPSETKPAETKPEETKPKEVPPPPPPVVVRKPRYNPYSATLKIRKGFETIDTIRILYDQDITHYVTDENAVNAFFAPLEMGPKFTQSQIDSAGYIGPRVNNKRTGSGIVSFENGAIYSGKIANNILVGYGYYSDEILDYKGMFANNKFSGLGICYYYDSQFEGIIKDIVFKGEFKDSKFWEGEVYYTTSDDKHYIQQFKQGNPISAKHYDE